MEAMTTHRATPLAAPDRSGEQQEPVDLPEGILTIERFIRRNDRGLRRPFATLFAPVLDGRLAAGVPPESGRLLAARAERLVTWRERRKLMREWEGVLERARTTPQARSPRAPLCRDRVIAAVGDACAMLSALASPLPVPARGVAMASRLLSDGTGPLYNRHGPVSLSLALRSVTAELDPVPAYPGTSANRL
jgi:hypothetical protein